MEIKKRILLIDDDALVLRSFQNLLSREGYNVITAASYQEALKAFEEKEFDLVLSDIRMPGKNGVETITEIQSRLKKANKGELPIIFITGFTEYGDELKAVFMGEVLTKPVDRDRLLTAIRDYL